MKALLAIGLYIGIFLVFVLLDYLLNKLGVWKSCNKALQGTTKFIGELLFDEKERGVAIFIWMIVALFLSAFIYQKFIQKM